MSDEQIIASDVIGLLRKRVTRYEKYEIPLLFAVTVLVVVCVALSSFDADAWAFAGLILVYWGQIHQQYDLNRKVLYLLEQEFGKTSESRAGHEIKRPLPRLQGKSQSSKNRPG